jgi:hypothetical protein
VLLFALAGASPAFAQLPGTSAAELGIGNRSVATTRGFAAVATNPAGLAMPSDERTTIAILPLQAPLEYTNSALGYGFEPVTLHELDRYGDESIPISVREDWIQRIERENGQTGSGDANGSVALSHGRFGFQLSTLSVVNIELNPDAAELLLFGNAGRTGVPREFRMGGSHFDAWSVTTAAVGYGFPLGVQIGGLPNQAFAVGATLKYTTGNLLYLGRDLGSFFSDDPLELWLRFPVVHTEDGRPALNAGNGLGLDLGFQWQGGTWSAGAKMTNLVSRYRWDLDELTHRPVTALLTQDVQEADFDERPATEAPEELLAVLDEFGFGRRLSIGAGHASSDKLRLFSQLDVALGKRSDPEPGFEAGVGAELQMTPRIPIRAHASALSGGVRLGGGAGVQLGRLRISAAGSWVSSGADEVSTGMLTVSLGGR